MKTHLLFAIIMNVSSMSASVVFPSKFFTAYSTWISLIVFDNLWGRGSR